MAIIRMNVHGLVLYDVQESYQEVRSRLDCDTDFVELHRRSDHAPVTINRSNIMDIFPSEEEYEGKCSCVNQIFRN